MDDLQKTVVAFIRQYMPDATSDAKKLKAYLCDCMPDERAKRKVMIDAYIEGIHDIIRNATDSKMATHKCFKILVDDCGFDEKPAAWAVETWACIYGHTDWKVAYEDSPPVDDKAVESIEYRYPMTLDTAKQLISNLKASKAAKAQNSKSGSSSSNSITNLKNKPAPTNYYRGSSSSSYSFDDESEEEKENNLMVDDIIDLEDAGLDVDELANMDWSDRYDAIEGAGLDPFEYDYGFDD